MIEPLKKWGYIYLAGFSEFNGCYKIGSTRDPFYRMQQLSIEFGEAKLFLVGYSTNALESERNVQFELRNLSNKYNILCRNNKNKPYLGSEASSEFFTFDDNEFKTAIDIISNNSAICYQDIDVFGAIV